MNATAGVSAVIPCFRCTKTLERAVASVAAQTIPPVELILVDDGSGDETRSLLVQLQSQHMPGWIRLVLLDANVGAASARNAGWDQAVGEYVAFIDADDAWHPRKIELQYKFMASATGIAISGHGHDQVDGMSNDRDVVEAEFQRVSPLYILLKNPFVTPSFMVRRDLQFRFLAGRRHMEDHYLLMQVSSAGMGIASSRVPLASIFKPAFGGAGLSADLLGMQKGEIENYTLMNESGLISWIYCVLLKSYSWVKYIRRYLIVEIRGMIK